MGLLALALLSFVTAPTQDDWPRFRGPHGAGTTTATALPSALDPEKNAAWRVELPPGYSSPIVVGERLFCTAFRDGVCVTICVDALGGEVLWTAEAPEPRHEWTETTNTPASPTPCSDGERVFVLFPTFGMLAYDLDGQPAWSRPMERFRVPHGMSSSPVAVRAAGRDLVLTVLSADAEWEILGQTELDEEVWSTPAIAHGSVYVRSQQAVYRFLEPE